MNEAIAIVSFIVGLQLTFSWRYHAIYTKLHNEFKKKIDEILEIRKKAFRSELQGLFKRQMDIQRSSDLTENIDILENPDYKSKEDTLFSLVRNINEPLEVYLKTRDLARRLSVYLLLGGVLGSFGLVPAAVNIIELSFLYFLFLFPFTGAILTWFEFSVQEKDLVEIRDRGR